MDKDAEQVLPTESLLKESPEGCAFRLASAAALSFSIGSIYGALYSNWGDIPKVVGNRFGPALARTGQVMLSHGSFFAATGIMYAGGECMSEWIRGKSDYKNGMVGGLAAGSIVGLRTRSIALGVGASVAMAFMSAVVDSTGHNIKGDGLKIDDGAIPTKPVYSHAVQR
ncbi:unnamed protein product [Ostreobium quekettii]|uniref:NADH-ubiquinone oxidoreductase subunit B14.7 n=1 Tax=Ostreobium quekettii TaxID=121088 RepID=A0A8S1J3P3_9CHLO|nr:unnamed protein product [Ostreobium quekettii]|eukprot:evm.model.scf_2606.2 EVM.evm.TU.scf_2606.2   scf_2606:11613-13643(-)